MRFFRTHKTFFLSIGFLVAFAVTVSYANPPASPYAAGSTLDPQCAPGDTNCTVAVGGGSSPWTVTGNNIYYNTGNVGIGTSTPQSALDVAGSITGSGLTVNGTTTTATETVADATNAQASIVYDTDGSLGYQHIATGYQYIYKVYAYKIVGNTRVYSANPAVSSTVNDDSSGNKFGISVSWNPVSGASGYRVLIYSDDPSDIVADASSLLDGFTAYAGSTPPSSSYDTTSNSFVDDGCGTVCPSGDKTVTPTSTTVTSTGSAISGGLSLDALSVSGTVIATGTDGSGTAVPDLGAGTRMEWIPSSSAFRAGSVDGTQWDSSNVGDDSVAFGFDTEAAAQYSGAFGDDVSVDANATSSFAFGQILTIGSNSSNSVAFGVDNTISGGGEVGAVFGEGNTLAGGEANTAFGEGNTLTNGSANIAFGEGNHITGGTSSVAFGEGNTISGQTSLVSGIGDTASGNTSTVFGIGNTASGETSLAFGNNTQALDGNSTAFGNGTISSGFTSTAFGNGSDATADYSTAFGQDTVASGQFSTAFGENTQAENNYDTAFGDNTVASGSFSTAFGNNTAASGQYSTAFGQGTIASGESSLALGNTTTALGDESTAFGYTTTASSYDSTSFGQFNVDGGTDPSNWVGTDPLFEIGDGTNSSDLSDAFSVLKNGSVGIDTATPQAELDLERDGSILAVGTEGSGIAVPDLGVGTRMEWIPSAAAFRAGTVTGTDWDSVNVGISSAAFGEDTTASGEGSAAFGTNTVATGQYATAFGRFSSASGPYSTAFGSTSASGYASMAFGYNGTTASGSVATAFGDDTIASGTGSTSFGDDTTAAGDYSTAFGQGTTATGLYSTAFGLGTTTASQNAVAIGAFNVDGGTDPLNWVATDPLFEIGNGTDSSDLNDALVILKNGDTGIGLAAGTDDPAYLLQVGSTAATGVVARFQNSSGTCDIDPTTSSLTCSSDMNLKKNIVNLADNSTWSFNSNISPANQTILADVLALNPVQYNWKTEADGTTKHPGFIAQEVQQVFPSLVATDPTTGLLSLNYTGLIPYTVAAIQQMNMNITSIDDLTTNDTWRDALENWFADSANGIKSLVVQNQICVDDQCLTKTDIQNLLEMEKQSAAQGSGTTTGQTDPNAPDNTTVVGDPNADSGPSDTGNTQTQDVTAPVIAPVVTEGNDQSPDTTDVTVGTSD